MPSGDRIALLSKENRGSRPWDTRPSDARADTDVVDGSARETRKRRSEGRSVTGDDKPAAQCDQCRAGTDAVDDRILARRPRRPPSCCVPWKLTSIEGD